MKNFIKLDDRYFRIALVDGKPVLNECKPEEVVEWEVERLCLTDDDPGVDASIFQEIIDKTEKDMKEGLEKSLKDLIVSSMGISRGSDNKFYISGFNDKDSPIIKLMATKVEARLKEVDLNKDLDLTDLEKKNLRVTMKKAFKEKYEQHVRNMVYVEAESLARTHVREIVKELADEKLKTVAKEMVERAVRYKKGT